MGFHTIQGGIYGLSSGLVMAPTSRGISLPIWSIAGLMGGAVGGLYDLKRNRLDCQVKNLKTEIQSHWPAQAE